MFTTRPDTLFGFSFLAVSIDHPISEFYQNQKFIDFKKMVFKNRNYRRVNFLGEKIGFKTELKAINPLSPDENYPFILVNFVLMDYGFCVFGCP